MVKTYTSQLESTTTTTASSSSTTPAKYTKIVILMDDIDCIASAAKHSNSNNNMSLTDASILSAFVCFIDKLKIFHSKITKKQEHQEQHGGVTMIMTCTNARDLHRRVCVAYRIDRIIPLSVPGVAIRKLSILQLLREIVLIHDTSLRLDVHVNGSVSGTDLENCSDSHSQSDSQSQSHRYRYPKQGEELEKCLDYCLFTLENVAMRIAIQTQVCVHLYTHLYVSIYASICICLQIL